MNHPPRFGVFLLSDFQEIEFWYPVLRLREALLPVTVIGLQADQTVFSCLGCPVVPDAGLEEGLDGFDVLVVPGGFAESAAQPALEKALAQAHARGATIAASGTSIRVLERAGLVRANSPSERTLLATGADDMPTFAKALLATAA
jgi:protease I